MSFQTFDCHKTVPHAQLVLSFARALSDGNFELASEMLSPALRSLLSPAELAIRYRLMIGEESGAATYVEIMTTMDEWPAKEPGDVGWAYAAIAGDRFSEAVACVVAGGAPGLAIRNIEWGRP